jgi:hypothetical protein
MAPATPYEHLLLDNILHQLQDLNHSVGLLNQDVATIKAKQTTIESQIVALTAPKSLELGKYVGLAKYVVPVLLALFLAISQAIAPTPEKQGMLAVERKRAIELIKQLPDTSGK